MVASRTVARTKLIPSIGESRGRVSEAAAERGMRVRFGICLNQTHRGPSLSRLFRRYLQRPPSSVESPMKTYHAFCSLPLALAASMFVFPAGFAQTAVSPAAAKAHKSAPAIAAPSASRQDVEDLRK